MGARPGPGFPACPGTGPAKGALAVGGGWGLAFLALLLRAPQSGGRKCRAPFPPRQMLWGASLCPRTPCSQLPVLQRPARKMALFTCAPRIEGSV